MLGFEKVIWKNCSLTCIDNLKNEENHIKFLSSPSLICFRLYPCLEGVMWCRRQWSRKQHQHSWSFTTGWAAPALTAFRRCCVASPHTWDSSLSSLVWPYKCWGVLYSEGRLYKKLTPDNVFFYQWTFSGQDCVAFKTNLLFISCNFSIIFFINVGSFYPRKCLT